MSDRFLNNFDHVIETMTLYSSQYIAPFKDFDANYYTAALQPWQLLGACSARGLGTRHSKVEACLISGHWALAQSLQNHWLVSTFLGTLGYISVY